MLVMLRRNVKSGTRYINDYLVVTMQLGTKVLSLKDFAALKINSDLLLMFCCVNFLSVAKSTLF